MKDGTSAYLSVAATLEFSKALSRHLKTTHSYECHCFSPFVWAETYQTSRNYVNAGLAFIWIRLFIQLWSMAKQLSVVSYLVITGVGRVLVYAVSSSVTRNGLDRYFLTLR